MIMSRILFSSLLCTFYTHFWSGGGGILSARAVGAGLILITRCVTASAVAVRNALGAPELRPSSCRQRWSREAEKSMVCGDALQPYFICLPLIVKSRYASRNPPNNFSILVIIIIVAVVIVKFTNTSFQHVLPEFPPTRFGCVNEQSGERVKWHEYTL